MKLLIFGTGMIVNDFLNGVQDLNLEKVYIYGRTYSKAKEIKYKFNLDKAFDNLDEALDSDAEVVYVGLPNNLHYEYAEKSILAGKDVIVEKPFMPNLNQAEKIWELAKSNNRLIFEASLVFYFPIYKQLLKDLPSLGEIHQADLNFSQYSSRYERFKNNDIAPALNVKNCGGALMDLNVYNINMMVGLYGKPKTVKYFATIKNGIDVNGTAILTYDNLQASCIASKSTSAPRHVTLQGESGSLYLPKSMSRAYKYSIDYYDGKTINRDLTDDKHRMYHEFIEFFKLIEAKDYKKCEELMKRTFITIETLDKCRKCIDLKFNCDK